MKGRDKSALFVVTEDFYFLSHRLSLARFLVSEGWRVGVACRDTGRTEEIAACGVEWLSVPWTKSLWEPAKLVACLFALRSLLRQWGGGTILAVSWRSILFVSIAGFGLSRLRVVNLLTGLGTLFTNNDIPFPHRVVRGVISMLSGWLLARPGVQTAFQNPDDMAVFSRAFSDHTTGKGLVIPGTGISVGSDCEPEPPEPPIRILYLGRFLWDKGIRELQEACRGLRLSGCDLKLVLVGNTDPTNPKSWAQAELDKIRGESWIELHGRTGDPLGMIRGCHIVALPSYREGFPRVLLEAGAVGRAVVTTDVPGCRSMVRHRVDGLLVPPRNAGALADALRVFCQDKTERQRMALTFRDRVKTDFSDDIVHGLWKTVLENETR